MKVLAGGEVGAVLVDQTRLSKDSESLSPKPLNSLSPKP